MLKSTTIKIEKRLFIALIVSCLSLTAVVADDQLDVKNYVNNMRGAVQSPGILWDIFTKIFDTEGKIKSSFLAVTDSLNAWYITIWDGVEFSNSVIYSTWWFVWMLTTSPAWELHIKSSDGTDTDLLIESQLKTTTTVWNKDARIVLLNDSSTVDAWWEIVLWAATDTATDRYASIWTDIKANSLDWSAWDVYIATKNNTSDSSLSRRFVVKANGNIWIWNTSPWEKLQVTGRISVSEDPDSDDDVGDRSYNDARYQAEIWAVACQYGIASINDLWNVTCASNAGTSVWTISGSTLYYTWANVGIGTTNPSSELDVVWSIRSNDRITADGSVSVPAFNFYNDIDSWLYPVSPDSIWLATGGATRLSIDSSWNVWLWTTSPEWKLDLNNGGIYNIGNSLTALTSSRLTLNSAGSVTLENIASQDNSTLIFKTWNNASDLNHILFSPGGSEVMRVQENGNVGIWLTSPTWKFDIKASVTNTPIQHIISSWGAKIFEVGVGNSIGNNANDWYVLLRDQTTGTWVQLNSNWKSFFNWGNVWIGTSTPSELLEINDTSSTWQPRVTVTSWVSSIEVAALWDAAATTDVETWFMRLRHEGTSNVFLIGSWDSFIKWWNVWIGTSSPAVTLDVAWAIRIIRSDTAPFTCDTSKWWSMYLDSDAGWNDELCICNYRSSTSAWRTAASHVSCD